MYQKAVNLSAIASGLHATGAGDWIRMRMGRNNSSNKSFHAHLDVDGNTGVSATVKIQVSNDGVNSAGDLATFALTNTVPDDGWPNAVPWGYFRVNVTTYAAGTGEGTPTVTVTMGEE